MWDSWAEKPVEGKSVLPEPVGQRRRHSGTPTDNGFLSKRYPKDERVRGEGTIILWKNRRGRLRNRYGYYSFEKI